MNFLDKIIGTFNPVAGVRRAAARQTLDKFERDYAAAGNGRRNRVWRSRGTSANAEVSMALSALRDRSRDFVRNSWAGRRILDVTVSHAIGTGIMSVPNTGSDRADRRYKLERERWERQSDMEGVLDFGGQQALMVRSMLEGGDCVGRMLVENYDPSEPVPFRVMMLEGDQIDSHRIDITDGSTRLGVALGQWNRRQGLYLHQVHPGEQNLLTGIKPSVLVDWNDLCHLFRPERIGQIRGIPVMAPILLTARELQDLMEAAIVQQRTQASFSGFIRRQPGGMNPLAAKKDDEGRAVTRIEPGTIQDIGDSEITFPNGTAQSVFGEAHTAGLRALAAGAGITYDQLTGDLSQANYSSLRTGKIEFRRLIEQLQWLCIVPMLCRKVDRRFEEMAILSGKLPYRRDGYRIEHVMPAIEPIDPKKDLEADILAVRAGRLSPQEFISAWGRDWRDVIEDYSGFLEILDKEKLTFDIDPRRPANGAAANAAGNRPPAGDAND